MSDLQGLLDAPIGADRLPGAVALIERRGDSEVAVAGSMDVAGSAPVRRDAVMRVASVTKPIMAAAAMALVDAGRMALGDPIARWLPELAEPMVVRTPASPVDDVVPAARPITVEDLLTSRAGWGFPGGVDADFGAPAIVRLMDGVETSGLDPQAVPAPDEWVRRLAAVPLARQPGEAWLYNTPFDVLGVLLARVAGRPLPDVLAEYLFGPLGIEDTGFHVPPGQQHRLPTAYRPGEAGGLEVVDTPDGAASRPPAFPSGAGGLVSTVDDLAAFGRMLLAGGLAAPGAGPGGRRVLSESAVRRMTTDHLTPAQRDGGRLFLEGQGWGYGGSVDVEPTQPWEAPGRYGWVGGTGTSLYVTPATGTLAILLTQVEGTGTSAPPVMVAFWRHAAGASRAGQSSE